MARPFAVDASAPFLDYQPEAGSARAASISLYSILRDKNL
jgi:hypothetical protein